MDSYENDYEPPLTKPKFPKKSLITLLIIGFLFVCNSCVTAIRIYFHAKESERSKTRFVVPGDKDLNLTEPGSYSVFYEYKSRLDGKSYGENQLFPKLPNINLSVKHKETDVKADLSVPSYGYDYTVSDRKGMLVYLFNVNNPGIYRFTGEYPKNAEGDEIVLAVSRDNFGAMIFLLATSFGPAFILLAAGVIAMVMFIPKLINYLNLSKKNRSFR